MFQCPYPFWKAGRMITPCAAASGRLLLEGLREGKGAISRQPAELASDNWMKPKLTSS